MTPKLIYLPCGSSARWDSESDMGYRCTSCFAIVGSIGQSDRCHEEANKWKTLKALGGRGWDYYMGRQEA